MLDLGGREDRRQKELGEAQVGGGRRSDGRGMEHVKDGIKVRWYTCVLSCLGCVRIVGLKIYCAEALPGFLHS